MSRGMQFLTDDDLSTIVHLPDGYRVALGNLTAADCKAIAATEPDAGRAGTYQALIGALSGYENFAAALKAKAFPESRYVSPVVPLFHEPEGGDAA